MVCTLEFRATMDASRRKSVLGAPYLGWRRSLSDPPPRRWTAVLRPFVRAFFHVMAVVTGIAIAVVFYTVPILAVAEVRIQGNQRLSAAAVRELAAVDGENVLALNVPEVQQRLLTQPWITAIQVRRRLPAVVEVRVEERKAGAVWEAANGRFLVATDGIILEPVFDPVDLPVVRDGDGVEVQPGQAVAHDPVALAYRLIQATPHAIGARVVAIEHRSADGLTVQTDNGWTAAIGDDANFERKLAVWRGVIDEVTKQGIAARFIDLRFGDRPYLR